uniref:Uncharacterized protein n=1 Tax=Oryza glumipatula TaxID=40148 RepID=A0A0D9Y8A0_9ORYZ
MEGQGLRGSDLLHLGLRSILRQARERSCSACASLMRTRQKKFQHYLYREGNRLRNQNNAMMR